MNATVDHLLGVRAQARALGDRGLEAAMTADLERVGYPAAVEHPAGLETTAVRAPETAVPKRGGGRPRKPRCRHNRIEGKCPRCREEGQTR